MKNEGLLIVFSVVTIILCRLYNMEVAQVSESSSPEEKNPEKINFFCV